MVQAKTGICSTCNIEDCNKYCALQAGKVLANFLYNLDVMKSSIGDIKQATVIGDKGLIISGMQIESMKGKIDLLSSLNTTLEVTNKFNTFLSKPPIQLIKGYFATLDDQSYNDYKQTVLEKLKGINNNSLLIVPFKPGTECNVMYKNERGGQQEITANISSIIWATDKNTGKLSGKVIVNLANFGFTGKCIKVLFEDYGVQMKNTGIEQCMKTNNFDRKSIQMTRFGYIKPLLIKDGSVSLGLDCSNLYLVVDSAITIIGSWSSNGELVETEAASAIEKTKAYKYIKTNLHYIEKHRRFIAPYALTEEAIIEL